MWTFVIVFKTIVVVDGTFPYWQLRNLAVARPFEYYTEIGNLFSGYTGIIVVSVGSVRLVWVTNTVGYCVQTVNVGSVRLVWVTNTVGCCVQTVNVRRAGYDGWWLEEDSARRYYTRQQGLGWSSCLERWLLSDTPRHICGRHVSLGVHPVLVYIFNFISKYNYRSA